MAVAVLVALPALLFGVPALLGHPVLPGDDLTQNFPLRVLAGREIRSGHLPLFDAYDWSGSPLLAGWNAGAAYPLTWLFGVLPGAAAWTIGMIATWVTAGTGTFAFLRALCLRPLPSFLGALSFALAGAMAAQAPHFGLVAGMSWVPLALLGVQKLTSFSLTNSLTNHSDSPGSTGWWSSRRNLSRPDLSRRDPRWTAVLAVAVGLIILAGEPRAIVDGFTIIGLYAVWQVGRLWFAGSSGASGLSGRRWFSWQHGRRALPAAALIAAGCLLGVGLGAVQWLPGLASIASSQRGTGSMALFSSGSLPPEWLTLTLIPDLLGGSGTLSQPPFFANYGLAEVTSYVGILPLVAAFALLVRAFGGRLPGTRRSEYLIWHVMGVVGIALALGGKSPLGQVLYRLPLFGSQRLQSRNILLLDLALAVLLAFWLNDPFPNAPRLRRGSLEAGESRLRARAVAETLAGVLPPIGILVLVVLSLTWGAGLLRWVGTGPARAADGIGPLRPWLIPTAVLAVAAVALVVFGHGVFRHGVFGHGVFGHRGLGRRLGRRWWGRACAGFVAVDVMVFTVLAVTRVAPTPSPSPSTAAA
ncbi:MAG: hypothetical protein J2P26_03825, partial [Nocardiopsaceae bacterium]|nr:hypothetical protein [Nocardiopsaceae bacterium]